ncbi:MAG: glycosyltransferase [Motiliproteus sp.]
MSRKRVVLSAVGLNQGGTLTVAKEIFEAADKMSCCRFIGLVHSKKLYPRYNNIKLIEVSSPKASWFCRLYFEFVSSYRISQRLSPEVWFALHDITSRVKANRQYVYCHNPTPFYLAGLRDLIFQPTVFVFSLFYRYLYRLNIRSNKAVFVQQCHIRQYFQQAYQHPNVVVARPQSVEPLADNYSIPSTYSASNGKNLQLFYPTLPRTFKNIELLIDAAKLLHQRGFHRFEIAITVSGKDSLYARYLVWLAKGVAGIRFIGRLPYSQVMQQYRQSDALVFPSKLETWGLPLTEAKSLNLPVLAADLSYARETLGQYAKVRFFDPTRADALADQIESMAAGKDFQGSDFVVSGDVPLVNGWDELVAYIMQEDKP